MSTARFVTIFAIVFAIAYTASEQFNLPLFTYHPRTGQLGWLFQAAADGPAMYWYGWLGTAALAALAAGMGSMALPQSVSVPVWAGWAIPLACMVAFLYFLRMFFFR